MQTISLKVSEKVLKETGRYACALGLSRAAYLRQAIANMNREARRKVMAEEMKPSRGWCDRTACA